MAELVRAIAASGDREAFALLFGHFAPRLKGYMMRLGSAPEEAEELAQEAMIQLWRRAATFDPAQSSLATWLFTIARNRRIDLKRRSRPADLDPSDPMLLPEAPIAADSAYEAMQAEERVRAAMAELPAEQKEMLELAFYREMSHGEIAAERGLPLGTVKSRIRLALARLKTAIDGKV
ncbi:MAG: sigma-70 family RNA polymerase sigma factor [Alphaproteobacteria bacterium]|nr:sigma-70 family RNA polymerase sigma factor [Alphaproteobacteria bacterium]